MGGGSSGQALDTARRSCNRALEQTRNTMPSNPRELITGAERRFPVRIRIAVPPEGLGRQHARMTAWLDESCGYFPDATLAGAFVARWCIGYKVETAKGAFRVREDEPTPRVGRDFPPSNQEPNSKASKSY